VLRIVQWPTGAKVNAGKSAGGLQPLANALLTVMPGPKGDPNRRCRFFDDIRARCKTEKFTGFTP
jgi:hypothetical protein